MKTKQCGKCKEVKCLDEFYRQQSGKYGRTGKCKKCRDKWNRLYRKERINHILKTLKINKGDGRNNIKDWYVADRISKLVGRSIKLSDIPTELIELKRIQLKLYREIYK